MHRPKKFDPPWIDFFKRPCPYYLKQHTTFPKFPLLPKELQLMIWKRVPQRPLGVAIRRNIAQEKKDGTSLWFIEIARRPSSLFAACVDSRLEALTRYDFAFGAYSAKPIPFNYEIDFLDIDHFSFRYLHAKSLHLPWNEIDLPKVKNITFYADIYHPTIDPFIVETLCMVFSQLRQLRVVEMDSNPEKPHTGLPYTFKPDERSFRHDWNRSRPYILGPLPFIRDNITEWTPPRLTIGTRAQWTRLSLESPQADGKALGDGRMEWEPTLIIPSVAYNPLYGRSG